MTSKSIFDTWMKNIFNIFNIASFETIWGPLASSSGMERGRGLVPPLNQPVGLKFQRRSHDGVLRFSL